jgi:diadenosine tetraphosphatase ApaH/serine/threonine PP2A family protein phosphatase
VGDTCLVHASPGDLWRAPFPEAPDAELEDAYADLGGAHAVYGHIHRPYVRRVGDLTVANAGSAGLPWDGDPRAAYLIVDDGDFEVARVAYDVEAETAALRASRNPEPERVAEMLRRGRFVAVDR